MIFCVQTEKIFIILRQTKNIVKNIFSLAIILFLLNGCSSVPLTGRKQFSFVSSSEMNFLAASSYKETLASSKLSTDAEQTAMIKRAGERISELKAALPEAMKFYKPQ